jgi:hypothetical protein
MIAKHKPKRTTPGRGLGGGRVCWGRATHSDLSDAFDLWGDNFSRYEALKTSMRRPAP